MMFKAAIVALILCLSLPGCSKVAGLLLGGGGPKVAANIQAGKTNSQTVGTTSNTDQRIDRPTAERINQSADQSRVKADRVETVVVQEYPAWLILAFAAALFLDSPLRWPGQMYNAIFRRKRT